MASPTLTVSLTSVATRESLLMGAVTSMLRQTRRPDRIKVFLSDQPFLRDTAFPNRQLPDQLDRFFAHYHQIVELHWISNHGPFRKFIPALQQADSDEDLIVTIDDDTYYIPTLLERLEQEAINHDCITANWCKRMKPQQHLCRLDYYEGLLGEEHTRASAACTTFMWAKDRCVIAGATSANIWRVFESGSVSKNLPFGR